MHMSSMGDFYFSTEKWDGGQLTTILETGDPEAAIAACKAAMAADSSDARYWVMYNVVAFGGGDVYESVTYWPKSR